MPVQIQYDNTTETPPSWGERTIQHYLNEHNIECEKATSLSGGGSGWTWRLDGFVDKSQPVGSQVLQCCALKYSDCSIKSSPGLETAPGRALLESRMMQSTVCRKASEQEPSVRVPRVLGTTSEAVIMSWGGNTSLHSAYKCDNELDVASISSRLGKWLACLHVAGIERVEPGDWSNEYYERFLINQTSDMRTFLAGEKVSGETIAQATAALENLSGVKTLTVCDFRPMNTLLSFEERTNLPLATVIDLEFSRYCAPAFDLQIWLAESLLLEAKHGTGRNFVSSFLSSYRRYAGPEIVTHEFVCTVAVAVGACWLCFLPMGIWDCIEPADVDRWKRIATEYIKAGAKQDLVWLSNSALGPLLG